jgi:ATP-dependent DNA helicase RecG
MTVSTKIDAAHAKPEMSLALLAGATKPLLSGLNALDLRTVEDLLFHLPHRYEDYTAAVPLKGLAEGEQASVTATLTRIATRRGFGGRRMSITEAVISDGKDDFGVIWFSQPYLAKSLKPGNEYRFAGKVTRSRYGLRLMNPLVENPDKPHAYVRPLMPVYYLGGGLNQHQVRKLIQTLEPVMAARVDPLSPERRREWKVCSLAEALRGVHVPESWADVRTASRRLAFDELLRLHLAVMQIRRDRERGRAPQVPFARAVVTRFVEALPFRRTNGQAAAAWAAIQDMEKGVPMNRLLDGDVGSGKTAVAAIVMRNVVEAGFQAALMAPTEILAKQHFETLTRLFADVDATVVLWTNAFKRLARRGQGAEFRGKRAVGELQAQVAAGEADIIVGTHALTVAKFSFRALALAVVDEQHRFGVRSRQSLTEKSGLAGASPHLLSMTATPIPRSLALTIFGDLDLSLLTEKPGGRQPIRTIACFTDRDKQAAYAAVREAGAAGRQTFVVCPLIDASDKLGVASVLDTAKRLGQGELSGLRLGVMHGKLSGEEKDDVMRRFGAGELDVLVSTSVVEVGVDVPNATVMVIEGAERFGLAQLHQFRGRVGRGRHASLCYLLPTEATDGVVERLSAFSRTDDGFALAELDLKARGPGDLLGERQSGFPALKAARLTDVALVAETKAVAEKLFSSGELGRPENAAMKAHYTIPVEGVHLE